MEFGSIYHRSALSDCYAKNADEVVINLRTGKDVTSVNLIHDDPFAGGAMGFAVYTDVLDRLWENPNPYDVETVLLYPENAPLQAVTQKVRQLTEQGLHVLALPRLPEDLRYQQLLKLEVNDFADHT